jgi:hypothetical protein
MILRLWFRALGCLKDISREVSYGHPNASKVGEKGRCACGYRVPRFILCTVLSGAEARVRSAVAHYTRQKYTYSFRSEY